MILKLGIIFIEALRLHESRRVKGRHRTVPFESLSCDMGCGFVHNITMWAHKLKRRTSVVVGFVLVFDQVFCWKSKRTLFVAVP